MLWLAKRVIFGETLNNNVKTMKDINLIEATILILLMITTIFFGFYFIYVFFFNFYMVFKVFMVFIIIV